MGIMKHFVKLHWLVLFLLLGTNLMSGQCIADDFTLTPKAGTCASNAEILVQLPNCSQEWEAILYKEGSNVVISRKDLDAMGQATFKDLPPANYSVQVVHKNDANRKSQPKKQSLTSTYKGLASDSVTLLSQAPSCQSSNDASINIKIKNDVGVGPYEVVLYQGINAQGNLKEIAREQHNKATTTPETSIQIMGTGTHPIQEGEVFVEIIDKVNNQVGCSVSTKPIFKVIVPKTKQNPINITAFFKPISDKYQSYEALYALYYQHSALKSDGVLNVKITRQGGVVLTDVLRTTLDRYDIQAQDVPLVRSINSLYNSLVFMKGTIPLQEGDRVEMVFADGCPATADVTTHINNVSFRNNGQQDRNMMHPPSQIRQITNDANCQVQGREIFFERAYRADNEVYNPETTHAVYSQFSEPIITIRLLKRNGSTWQLVGQEQDINIGTYLQGANKDAVPFSQKLVVSASDGNGDYRVEAFVKSIHNGVGQEITQANKAEPTKYFSHLFSVADIGNISVATSFPTINIDTNQNSADRIYTLLEGTSPGVRIRPQPAIKGGADYSVAQPLTLTITRKDARPTDTFVSQGPLSLADNPAGSVTYTITYPKIFQITNNQEFVLSDLPSGEYNFRFTYGCLNVDKSVVIDQDIAQYNDYSQIVKGTLCSGSGTIEYDFFNTIHADYASLDGQQGRGNRPVEASDKHTAILYKDNSSNGQTNVLGKTSDVRISYNDAQNRKGALVMSASTKSKGWKGQFFNVPAGRYILQISDMEAPRRFSVIDNPTNGYTKTELPENWNGLKGSVVYYPIEIPNVISEPKIDYIASLCDPNDTQTGLIQVELHKNNNVTYPIQYQLLLEDNTPAIDNTGVVVPIHMVNSSVEGSHVFTKIPKHATQNYKIRVYDACGNTQDVVVMGLEAKTYQVIGPDSVCPNTQITLEVDLPEVYQFEWTGPIPVGVDKTSKRITFVPAQTGTYVLNYTPKRNNVCGTQFTAFQSEPKNVVVVSDNEAPIINGMDTPKNATLNTGECTSNITWNQPTATDPNGCLNSFTWRIEDATTGAKVHPTNGENTTGTSWDFPQGQWVVVYTAIDKAGNKTEERLNVVVDSPVVQMTLTNSYVDDVNAPMSKVVIGGKTKYKVSVKNTSSQNIFGVTLTIKLPNHNQLVLPTSAQVDVSQITGTTIPNVIFDPQTKIYTISNIADDVFVRNSTEKNIFFPIEVTGDCRDYQDACKSQLVSETTITFSGGNRNCAATQSSIKDKAVISVDKTNGCIRQELYCDTNQQLASVGSGYTSYQWYLNGNILNNETQATLNATQPGVYEVKQLVDCNGVPTSSSEVIHLLTKTELVNQDPIKAQSDGGAVCGNTGQWVSHFFLCDGKSKELKVTFDNANVSWQKYNNTGQCTSTTNCQKTDDDCWTEVSTAHNFTISEENSYRLRITGNTNCVQDFYFSVYTTGLGGVIVPSNQDNNNAGAVTITMDTEGIPYIYTLKDANGNVAMTNNPISKVGTGSNTHTFTGLVIPRQTAKTFTIEVTSNNLPDCKFVKTFVIEDKTTISVTGEFVTWVDCSDANFKFQVNGGQTPYRVAVYSIDGNLEYPNTTLEDIPDTAFTTPGSANAIFTEKMTIKSPGSNYIFVVRNANNQNVLTEPIFVPYNPNFQVESSVTDSFCSDAGSTITVRFLPNLGLGQKVTLFKLSPDGTTRTQVTNVQNPNNSGVFVNQTPGKYIAQVETLLGKKCSFEREIVVSPTTPPLVGYVGIEKDISCEPQKGYKVRINNVSGGTPPYKYSFLGGTAGTFFDLNVGYISNASSVYVQDAKGCKLELPVNVDPAMIEPNVPQDLHPLITYNCSGDAVFTINPQTPAGKDYTYEYRLDNALVTNDFVLSPKPNGTAYTINIYYQDNNATITQSNVLIKETFGVGDETCHAHIPLTCISSASLSEGTYAVTSNLNSNQYEIPALATSSGRYMVAVTSTSAKTLYQREIKDLSPHKALKVSFNYINLLKQNSTKADPTLQVILQVGANTYTRNLPSVSKGSDWLSASLLFDELENINQTETKATLTILTSSLTSIAVGLDDIEVSHKTERCRVPITRLVTPLEGKAFTPTLLNTQNATCIGQNGKAIIEVANNNGSPTLEYAIGNTTNWLTANLKAGTTSQFEISLPAGQHQIRFRKDDCVLQPMAVNIAEPKEISVINGSFSASKIGCVAPFLKSVVTFRVEGGTKPYKSVAYREKGSVDWLTANASITNDVAVISELSAKTYEFAVQDKNDCSNQVVIMEYTIPNREDIRIEHEQTHCYTEGQGFITIKALSGIGPYKFTKDGGATYEVPNDINATEMTYEGLDAGTYSIGVQDSWGCFQVKQVTIYPEMKLKATSDNAFDCSNNPQENITLELTGGRGQKTFKWRRGDVGNFNPSTDNDGGNVIFETPVSVGGITTVIVRIKQEGIYYFEVEDENFDALGRSCSAQAVVGIKTQQPQWKPNVVLVADDISCQGASTGFIGVREGAITRPINLVTDIDASKGLYPFTIHVYKKENGVVDETTDVTLNNLSAGTYVVRLKDAKNCVATDKEVIIGEIPKPELTLSKIDVSCSQLGTYQYGRVTASWQAGGTPNFSVSLYTDKGVLSRNVKNNNPHHYNNKNQGETVHFEEVMSGKYIVVLVDSKGCRTEKEITISGLDNEIKLEPQPVTTCNIASLKVITYDPNTPIDPTKVKIAVFKGGNPSDATLYTNADWVNATAETIVQAGATINGASAILTGLVPGATYKVVVNNNGCYNISESVQLQKATTINVDNLQPIASCNGADGNVSFTLSNIPNTINTISYQILSYPQKQIVTPVTPVFTAGNTSLTHTTTNAHLDAGEYYVVFTENGTNCTTASSPFIIEKSDVPLQVTLQLLKNETCNTSAHIMAEVIGGKSGFKYIFKESNTPPTPTDWEAVASVTDRRKEVKNGINLASTIINNKWFVFVQDAYGCVSQSEVDIQKDEIPNIASATPENLCAINGQYMLRVVMASVGSGQHYYSVERNGVVSPLKPITFAKNNAGQDEFVATGLYSDLATQVIKVYDFNKCVSNTVSFEIGEKLTYDVVMQKPLTCHHGVTGQAQWEIRNMNNMVAGKTYTYRVVHLSIDPVTNQEVEQEQVAMTPVANPVFFVPEVGKYKVYVYDDPNSLCPIGKTFVVNHKEMPILTLTSVVDETCPETTQIGNGTGRISVSAGGFSIKPFKFAIIKAVDMHTNTEINIPTDYATYNSNSITDVLEVDVTQTMATFLNLKGSPYGIRYFISVTSEFNECISLPLEVVVRAPFPIAITPGSIQTSSFVCDASQKVQNAKIVIDERGISGGTLPYTYVFSQAGVELQNSQNPEYVVLDRTGGIFRVKIIDGAGCQFQDPTDYAIEAYSSIESIEVTSTQKITCDKKENINISITTDPVSGIPQQGFTYVLEKLGSVTRTEVTNNKQHSFAGLDIGTYKITVKNNDTNCQIYSSYIVKDPNTYIITASDPKQVTCFDGNDGEITLTFVDTDLNDGDQAPAGFTYEIRNIFDATVPPIISDSFDVTTKVTGLKSGTYNVVATSKATACKTRVVSQFSIPQAQEQLVAFARKEYEATCSNDQGEILVEITGGVAPYRITLRGSNGVQENIDNVYDKYLFVGLKGGLTPGTFATYTIEVEDHWGCRVVLDDPTKAPKLEYALPISLNVDKEGPTCRGGENGYIHLNNVRGGSGIYFYELKGLHNAKYYFQRNTDFTGLTAGTYQLTVTDRWGCQFKEDIEIIDPGEITITEIDRSQAVCYEEVTGDITIQVSGGVPGLVGYTVQLVDAKTQIIRDEKVGQQPNTDVTFEKLSPRIKYEIHVVDAQQCKSKVIYPFEIEALPNLSAQVQYTDRCENNVYKGTIKIVFEDNKPTVNIQRLKYAINSTDIADAKPFDDRYRNLSTLEIDADVIGAQTLTLFYIQPSTIAGKPDIVCQKVSNKYVVPEVKLLDVVQDNKDELLINEIRVQGKFGKFDESQKRERYIYYFNGHNQGENNVYLVKRSDPDVVHPDTGKKVKLIKVVVEDAVTEGSCTKEIDIYHEYIDVYIPDYFTPNNDGINDRWAPQGTDHYPNMSVYIFDRYGRPITTLRRGQSWDGKYKGQELTTGDYWYIFKLNEENDAREFKGHFTLYR